MYTIVHSTSIGALNNILKIGYLLDQNMRKKFNVIHVGEGSKDRKVGTYTDSLLDEKFWKNVDEANGIYFRLGPIPQGKADVQMVFSPKLLDQYKPWVFNTTENFGFMIAEEGVEAESPFSGDEGTTYISTIPASVLPNLDRPSTELLIPESVNLDNLVQLRYKSQDIMDKRVIPILTNVEEVVV